MSTISSGTTSTTTLVHSGDTTGALVFKTNDTGSGGTEAMRIDTSQNVGIGTASPSYPLDIRGTSGGGFGVSLFGGTTITTAQGTNTNVDMNFVTKGSGLYTFTQGATERMRIDSSGYLRIGDVSYTDARITASENLTSNNGITVKNTVTQTGSQWFMAFRNSANATAGTIAHTGTTTVAYNTSSDIRLKENIADAPKALPIVENINVRSYDWKEDKRHIDFGFVAQELHTHFPEAVFVGDNEEELINEKGIWQVEYGRLTPILLKAIQELKALVDTQATEIAELKAKT